MVTLNPTRVPQGSPAQISVSVQSLNGTALSGLWVQLCGGPISGGTFALNASPDGNFYSCTSGEPTDANGLATVSFTPLTNGVVWLYLNNDTTPSYVTVYSGLQIVWSPSSPVQNDTVTVTVSKIGSTVPPSGVTVYVEQNGSAVSGFPQTASSNGQVVIPNVQQGTYNVTAVAAGFQNATAQIVVGPAAVAPPPAQAKFQLSNLNVPSTGTVGQPLTASADISNTGNADGTANALLIVNGAVRDTRSIPIAAGGRETVAFDFTPTQAGSFQVTIKLATGETLAEQTVTISTPQSTTTTTTTTTTTPSITTTTTTTTSTTTVSSTPTPSSPHVPGFEVVALVGALAVALLVMRRRQK
jgi:MYXO-CTERM domain-containing protein